MSAPSTQRPEIRRINRLVAACSRAVVASEEACARLGDPIRRRRVRGMIADHQSTIDELGRVVVSLGGTPARPTSAAFRARRVVARAGSDRAVLAELKQVDDATWAELDRALDRKDLSKTVRVALHRSLRQCVSHRRFFEAQLAG